MDGFDWLTIDEIIDSATEEQLIKIQSHVESRIYLLRRNRESQERINKMIDWIALNDERERSERGL